MQRAAVGQLQNHAIEHVVFLSTLAERYQLDDVWMLDALQLFNLFLEVFSGSLVSLAKYFHRNVLLIEIGFAHVGVRARTDVFNLFFYLIDY